MENNTVVENKVNTNTIVRRNSDTISVGEWFWTMFVMTIPIVNIVMALVWGFSSNTKISKANFFKAYLLWLLVATIFCLLFASAFINLIVRSIY
jgi:hypothetical protein